MNPSKLIAVAVGLLIVAGAALFFGLRGGDVPAPELPPTGSVATLPPGPTIEPSTGPVTEPSIGPTIEPSTGPVTDDPVDSDEGDLEHEYDLPATELLATLTVEEEVAAADFATQVAAAVTTQIPDENRSERLAPYFTAESNGTSQDGPLSGDTTVEAISVDWATWTETGNETELGRVVTVRYGSSAGGQYTEGAVTWELRLVRAGTGWLASYVDMGSTG